MLYDACRLSGVTFHGQTINVLRLEVVRPTWLSVLKASGISPRLNVDMDTRQSQQSFCRPCLERRALLYYGLCSFRTPLTGRGSQWLTWRLLNGALAGLNVGLNSRNFVYRSESIPTKLGTMLRTYNQFRPSTLTSHRANSKR